MGKQFEVEWSDFSGGYYVGARESKQPQNTWVGDGVIACAGDGFLMPGAPLAETALLGSGGSTLSLSGFVALDGASLSYGYVLGGTKNLVVTGDAGSPFSLGAIVPQGRPVWFQGRILLAATTAVLIIYNAGAVTTSTVTPAAFSQVFSWDLFAIGVSSNRLYFSAPADPTSWNSNDYIDVGEGTIRAVVPTLTGLLVGTDHGWWQVTGVLGQTTTIRQVSTKGCTAAGGVSVDAGVFFAAAGAPEQAVVRILNGSQTPTALWDKDAAFTAATQIAKVAGSYVLVSVGGNKAYVWSEHARNWRRIAVPTSLTESDPTDLPDAVSFADDPSADASSAIIVSLDRDTLPGPTIVRAYRQFTYDLDPFDPPVDSDGTGYQQATVDLASYDHKRPFRIDELIVELDLGATSLNATRSLGVTIKAPSAIVDYHASLTALAANGSQPATFTLPAMATTNYERPVIRFSPNDAGPTMSFAPSLTMRGVKIRRVIARCTEDG